MNISKQLKNYRKEFNISQETLAEVIHVSRQTISNWENDKSYPDLQSLILLSDYFKVSLDELVKGDVVKMKTELKMSEINKLATWMVIGFILMIVTLPLGIKFSPYLFVVPLLIWIGTMVIAFKVEKIKKEKHLRTYREIVNYMEKGEIPEEKKDQENLKTKLIKALLGALVGGVIGVIVFIFNN